MKKFIVNHHTPTELLARQSESSPEDMEEGMKEWMQWATKCGDHLVDVCNPLMRGQKLNPDNSGMQSDRVGYEYSILQTGCINEAKYFFRQTSISDVERYMQYRDSLINVFIGTIAGSKFITLIICI